MSYLLLLPVPALKIQIELLYARTRHASARAASRASGSFVGSLPPAWAAWGRPPPPPPAVLAASRTQSPALRPLAIRSSLTTATKLTLPSTAEPSSTPRLEDFFFRESMAERS